MVPSIRNIAVWSTCPASLRGPTDGNSRRVPRPDASEQRERNDHVRAEFLAKKKDDGWEVDVAFELFGMEGVADAVMVDKHNRKLTVLTLRPGFSPPYQAQVAGAVAAAVALAPVYGGDVDFFDTWAVYPDLPQNKMFLRGPYGAWAKLPVLEDQLYRWLHKPEGDAAPGPWCRGCDHVLQCRAHRWLASEWPETLCQTFGDLTEEEVGLELDRLEEAESLIRFRKRELLQLAEYRVKIDGVVIPGWGYQEGRSQRAWIDEYAAEAVMREIGIDPYVRGLKSPAQAEAEIDKTVVRELSVKKASIKFGKE